MQTLYKQEMHDLKTFTKTAFKRIITRTLLETKKGQFLLLKRAPHKRHAGTWDLPGGGTEKGETPKSSAKKETKEETGFKAKKTTPVAFLEKKRSIRILFTTSVKKKFSPNLDKEHTDYRWVKKENLPSNIHPSTKKLLDKHLENTKG